MVPFMAGRVVLLRELDPIALYVIDDADVDSILPDNFHVFFDFGHCLSSVLGAAGMPAAVLSATFARQCRSSRGAGEDNSVTWQFQKTRELQFHILQRGGGRPRGG